MLSIYLIYRISPLYIFECDDMLRKISKGYTTILNNLMYIYIIYLTIIIYMKNSFRNIKIKLSNNTHHIHISFIYLYTHIYIYIYILKIQINHIPHDISRLHS